MDSNVQQWPGDNIQPEINELEGKPVEVTDVSKTFADSVSEFMVTEKEHVISHFDELTIGS